MLLDKLQSVSSFRLRGMTVHWSARENAVGYLVAWGPCDYEDICDWRKNDPPGPGASTRTVSDTGASNYTYTLPSLSSGSYYVLVMPLGDGVAYQTYGGLHGTRFRIRDIIHKLWRLWQFFVAAS